MGGTTQSFLLPALLSNSRPVAAVQPRLLLSTLKNTKGAIQNALHSLMLLFLLLSCLSRFVFVVLSQVPEDNWAFVAVKSMANASHAPPFPSSL